MNLHRILKLIGWHLADTRTESQKVEEIAFFKEIGPINQASGGKESSLMPLELKRNTESSVLQSPTMSSLPGNVSETLLDAVLAS